MYCGNSPIQYVDPSGFTTIALGLGAGGAFSIGATGSIQLVIDDKGNVGIIGYSSAQSGTPNLSMGWVLSISNADTIYDLEGASYVAGGSAGLVVGGGLEFAYATSPLSGKDVVTVNISAGVGKLPAELHVNFWGNSGLLFSSDSPLIYILAYAYIEQLLCNISPVLSASVLGLLEMSR